MGPDLEVFRPGQGYGLPPVQEPHKEEIMKRRLVFLLSALWCVSGYAASLTPVTTGVQQTRSLPVLVRVNSHGQVTEVMPAYPLSPRVDRLVRKSLDAMVTKPATYHGRPVASQAVVNLALQPATDTNGSRVVRCSFVSIRPVPTGEWYWMRLDGRRLALAEVGGTGLYEYHRRPRFPEQHFRIPASQAVHPGPSAVPTQTANAMTSSMRFSSSASRVTSRASRGH